MSAYGSYLAGKLSDSDTTGWVIRPFSLDSRQPPVQNRALLSLELEPQRATRIT